MTRYQERWVEQCKAAKDILDHHGLLSALDYLVGEKFMTFVATAEDHPEFARELPKFVAAVREIFGTESLRTYVGHLADLYREGEAAAREAKERDDEEELGIMDEPASWIRKGERLASIQDLLTADRLGTA